MRRRDFLKTGLGLAGSSLLLQTGCANLDQMFGPDAGFYDETVLIVGGGLAGLSAAYELKHRKIPYQIIEKSSRPGGRVRTLEDFNEDKQFAELGAEFVDGRHTSVFALCADLSLTLEAVDDSAQTSAFWFRDRLISKKELSKELQPILSKLIRERLSIAEDEDKLPDVVRRGSAISKAIDLDRLSFEELLLRVGADARPAALDYFRRSAMASFGVEASQQSALHYVMSLDPDARSTGLFRVRGGNQRLTRGLFESVAGVIPDYFARFDSQLISIRRLEKGFECRIRTGQSDVRTVKTRAVLFAVPPVALKNIDGFKDLSLDPVLVEAVSGWTMGHHSKTVVSFRERFWNNKHEGPASASLLGDFPSQNCWDSSRGQNGKEGLISFQIAGRDGEFLGAGAPAQAVKDLSLIWKKAAGLDEDNAIVQNWSQQQGLGGSISVFAPGHFTKWNGIFEDVKPKSMIAFAGEHTSSTHMGTMEGAISSGRRAAQTLAASLVKKS